MGRGETERGALKSVLMVAGGLAVAWITIETAFKPWLDRLRSSISRADPASDPDDADSTVNPTIVNTKEVEIIDLEQDVNDNIKIRPSD